MHDRPERDERRINSPPRPGTEGEHGERGHDQERRRRTQRTRSRTPSPQGEVNQDAREGEAGCVNQAFPEHCTERVHDRFPPFFKMSSSNVRSLDESAFCSMSRTSKSSREPRKTRSSTSERSFRETSSYD